MNSETMNADTHPNKRMMISLNTIAPENFRIFIRLAPNMTGIATSKVNSVAALLLMPNNKAAIIVAPDLETPGNTAATS